MKALNGAHSRILRFCIFPAVIAASLAVALAVYPGGRPGPGHNRTGAPAADCYGCESAPGTAKAAMPSTDTVSAIPVRSSDARAMAALSREEAARARLDHRFHVRHLEHVRLEEALAAGKAEAAAAPPAAATGAAPSPSPAYGSYSYAMLEQLWVEEGGSAGEESTAACIAEHESGGNPGAVSPTDDYGLWQINASNASPSLMLNPDANAREAISLSDDGTNWGPWTTAPDCDAAVTASVSPSGGIAAYALGFRGYPYVWGGDSPSGFDCSGFAQYVYAHFGMSIPRTSEEQAAYLESVSDPSPGDLVFYWSGGDAFHVAVFLGGSQVISALNQSTGVVVTPLSWPGSDYSFGALA
jgi:cell wall-associated NlpC family hydrolase